MQDTFEMLEELLEQEQFELLFPKENGAQAEGECYETYENNERKQGEKDGLSRVGKEKIPGDIRLVYLMNDAVESFLIFRDARLTGSYLENYEGPLKSSLSQEGDEYILVVWQGENVVTLFFRMLDLEVYLYNYGKSVISGYLGMNICDSWNIGSPLQEISWNIWEKSFVQKKNGRLCNWRTFPR